MSNLLFRKVNDDDIVKFAKNEVDPVNYNLFVVKSQGLVFHLIMILWIVIYGVIENIFFNFFKKK